MTDALLQAIENRAAAASSGPWGRDGVRVVMLAWDGSHGDLVCRTEEDPRGADGDFIAAAREDVPALLAEVERLRGVVAQFVEAAEHALADRRTQPITETLLSVALKAAKAKT